MKLHRDLPCIKRDVKLAYAMFMGIQLAGFLCESCVGRHQQSNG